MSYKPLYINDNGDIREVTQFHVNDNGTIRTVEEGYVNDNGTIRHIYSKHPYPPGTDVFTWNWNKNGTLDMSPFYSTYPEAFVSEPGYIQGSGGGNSKILFELAEGFGVYRYSQSEHGTFFNPDNDKGQDFVAWMGITVSGLERFDGAPGSGNNNTTIVVRYFG